MVTKPPPKIGRYKDKRIIKGVASYVIIENDKVVEVLGPVKKPSYPEQEVSKEEEEPKIVEEKPKIGLPLISADGSYVDPGQNAGETNGNIAPQPENQEQKPMSNIHLTTVPIEDVVKIFTKSQRVPESEVKVWPPNKEIHKEPPNVEIPQNPQITEAKAELPKVPTFEPLKPPQNPEIKIPKLHITIPQENNAPMQNTSNQLGNSSTTTYPNIFINDTYQKSKETEVVGTSLQKADEGINSQQPKEKSKVRKERRSMAEELEAELLTERKFEEWLKKQKFRENLEKAARYAEETKTQFEEKIPELSNRIEGITGEVKGVEERLGTMDKSVGTLCTGVDCIKDDVRKTQEAQAESDRRYRESQEQLEKMVQERFNDLGEKVQSLEHPTFTCESCGEQVISPLSSYCPNCGAPITSWSDEEGQPVRGWTPYWKRMGRSEP